MINAEVVNKVIDAQKELFDCRTKSEINKVFKTYQIDDVGARIALLNKAMRLEACIDAPPDAEKFYEETLEFFAEGRWRELI